MRSARRVARALSCWGAIVILCASLPSRADDFAFEVASPNFKVTVPGIPQLKMEVHPRNASQPHLRFLGSDGPYAVSVFTPAAAAGMTPLECASATARTLGARPGVPPPAEVYKTRLNSNTFLAFYVSTSGGTVQMHAHLLSAAGGTHCIEVHATKISVEDEDLAAWITELEKAGIEAD